MKYPIAEAITELRSEFEGGKALALDFYTLLKRGARNTLDSINPETLKRRTPVYGGVANNLAVYYCPDDVRVPSAIYRQPHDKRPVATYTTPSQFYVQNLKDAFTIETINGVKFILLRQSVPYYGLTLDEMNEVGTKVSDETLLVNNFNYISGTGALEREFGVQNGDITINRISDELTRPINITDYANGVVLIPMVFEDASKISRVEFVLESSNGDFYTMTSLTDSVGDNFIDGINLVRFSMNRKTASGSPIDTQITDWHLKVETTEGTQKVIIDKISLQKTAHYYFEYYSNRLFIDGTTGAWKETPASGDYVHLEQEARDILHYETVLLIAQGNTKIRQSRNGFDNFTAQLSRKYQTYWSRYPSTEQPISYNTLDREMPLLPDYIGQNMGAGVDQEQQNSELMYTEFADNETPSGVFDGVNDTFTLTHSPNPVSSLMLWLNGTYLTQGVDYTISNDIITFTSPPSIVFAGTPFIAFYRYSL
jgi:hypothetical protein